MLKFTFVSTYVVLSGSVIGTCFGLPEALIAIPTAALYLLMAFDEWKKR